MPALYWSEGEEKVIPRRSCRLRKERGKQQQILLAQRQSKLKRVVASKDSGGTRWYTLIALIHSGGSVDLTTVTERFSRSIRKTELNTFKKWLGRKEKDISADMFMFKDDITAAFIDQTKVNLISRNFGAIMFSRVPIDFLMSICYG
ncbi:hypothetical protein RRG08_061460 [Elysia crispata]|uniref:Uncharacterized protein n=1 Tax=Elysia crispata TaxID=231223 RepID=A0AAE0YUA7_9GAST|nr:hypothetical protein RRG08_010317 [Elysia crispata]KAK3757175.1 hypothetical protein RRG08_061460 [Elysia crispata]